MATPVPHQSSKNMMDGRPTLTKQSTQAAFENLAKTIHRLESRAGKLQDGKASL